MMKYIVIKNTCNGCGLCFSLTKYIEENDDGNAKAIPGVAVSADDYLTVTNVEERCPVNAFGTEAKATTDKIGIAGVKDVINNLRLWIDNFSVDKVERHPLPVPDEGSLWILIHELTGPCNSKVMFKSHTTESKAMKYAKDCFERYCWSERAWKNVVRKVLFDSQAKHLKEYYTLEDTEDSAYYKYNVAARKKLGETLSEIKHLYPACNISEEWKNFSFYPDKNLVSTMEDFNYWKGDISVMEEVKGWLADKSYYFSCIEVDGFDDGCFLKRTGSWHADMHEALEEFEKDLTTGIQSLFKYDLEPEKRMNQILGIFEEQMKKKLKVKVEELESYLLNGGEGKCLSNKSNILVNEEKGPQKFDMGQDCLTIFKKGFFSR